jgi:hypothetical protein
MENARILLRREPKDTEQDVARWAAGKATVRHDESGERVDVTDKFPSGVVKALRSSPLNCAHFVKTALKGSPPALEERSTLFTVALWQELLAAGFRVSGIWQVDKSGKVSQGKSGNKRHKIATPQSQPVLGDIVFMVGAVTFKEGRPTTIDPAGANFNVSWDHVGIFLVRDSQGRDWHLAKDGDENPLGVYHTGTKPEVGVDPGAYVEGLQSLVMYLTPPPSADWQDAGAGRR